jgi:hypothetical protein
MAMPDGKWPRRRRAALLVVLVAASWALLAGSIALALTLLR